MEAILAGMSPTFFTLACGVALVAGTDKGAVGFGMPMILVSGLGMFLSPEIALAALIIPTVVANGAQALRQGPRAAIVSVRRFHRFLLVGFVALVASAQMVRVMPQDILLLLIGSFVVVFTSSQLAGWRLQVADGNRAWIEVVMAALAGFTGGMSGVWGPPTIAYLTALDTPKREHVRVQGVIYGLGAVALLGAHIQSGIFNWQTATLSFALLGPAYLGMWLGGRLHDRMDQALFRRATLLGIAILAANLIRKGLMG